MFGYCLSIRCSSGRWSATSACLKAAHGHTARRGIWGLTRRHTGASTHSCVTNRAVERPSSPLTVSRSTFGFTPRKSRLSVMCKAVRRLSTRCTGEPAYNFCTLLFFYGAPEVTCADSFISPQGSSMFFAPVSVIISSDHHKCCILLIHLVWKIKYKILLNNIALSPPYYLI